MTAIMRVQDLSYSYPKSNHAILQNISFALIEGEVGCILGTNGCGKSTLLKLLACELSGYEGHIIYPRSLTVAYISQDIHHTLFAELTLEENLRLLNIYFPSIEEKKRYLEDYHPKLFDHLSNILGTLSGGEKQAFALACSLYCSPRLLLLDEHTSALDPESEQRLMQLTYRKIKKQKITTLMCTHKIELVKAYANHILGLNKGRLVLDISHSVPQDLSKQQLEKIYF